MSGIVGIYNLDGRPVEQIEIQRMLDSIAHRGPDGSGMWTDGPSGLGHQMLWTTPESLHEKLPLTNKAGNLTITADARIDNRDELIPALNFNGKPRERITDSEVILAAYEKWGEKCPEKLLGDFSFAIHDKRNQIIYCARDPVGIKPFYYYFKGGKFRWASEPKAIFEDKTISKEPNLPLICVYLLNRFDEREETLYKDVNRLPPSHFMVLENGKIRKDVYWDIDPNYAIRYKTDQEYAEHFGSLFNDAVRTRLRGHGPVGALLSGGLDSSSIVCTAQMLYQKGVIPNNGFESFSIVFDHLPCDERHFISEVVLKWNVQANYFTCERHLSCLDFEQIEQYPDVGYHPNLFLFAPVFLDATQKGIKAMLNGVGGDELLATSFDHLTELMSEGRILKLLAQLWSDSRCYSYSPYSLFFNHCFKPLIPQPIKKIARRALRRIHRNGVPSWLNFARLKEICTEEQLREVDRLREFPSRSQQRIYDGLFYGWNANIALDMVERFAAHFGLERRYPFFDRRLLEFLIALPEDQRWSNQCTKAILRRGAADILPVSIVSREDKTEFSCAIDQEFKDRQVHKMEKIIQTSMLATLGLINADRFYQTFNEYRNAKTFHSFTNRLVRFIWLELWLRSVTDVTKRGG